MTRFHPKDVVCGEVHRTDVAHGTNQNTGKDWHRFSLTLVRRVPGKWNPDTKENEVFESYVKSTWFGKEDEINKMASKLRQRDVDAGIAGHEVRVTGYVKTEMWTDKTTGEEKVSKTPIIDRPEFDWAFFYENNVTTQVSEEPVAAAAPARPTTPPPASDDPFGDWI